MALKPKQLVEVALGVLTSIGGYLDVGAIATSSQAGAEFGFRHLWVIGLGTLAVVFLLEMSGRFAAVSRHTIREGMRERLGFSFFVTTCSAEVVVDVLILASEIGGISLALQLVTGVPARWWAVPVGLFAWLLLWKGTFGVLEKGVALLGLVTLAFVVAVVRLHPAVGEVARGFIPGGGGGDAAHYWFVAVSILGALISPYLFYFYSAGAVEDGWGKDHIATNRMVAGVGMTFGSVVACSVLIVAAVVFLPRGIHVDQYEQVALGLTSALGGSWGFYLFAASLGIACLGAALEVSLAIPYVLAQGLGWVWGENKKPSAAPRFAITYTIAIVLGVVPILLGVDPLKLTVFSMALTAVFLPLAIFPFLVLMNDERYLGEHRNGRLSNFVVIASVCIAFVLALVTIPLEIMGG
ncbi:MAG TPA: divalent metal cation transporter [Longimicrobium sp.]|nr:divalent metal cation transporter [Longimicrobium sp.]HSU14773.1 divalent metal cation transporter [Longimicrobium sp.]